VRCLPYLVVSYLAVGCGSDAGSPPDATPPPPGRCYDLVGLIQTNPPGSGPPAFHIANRANLFHRELLAVGGGDALSRPGVVSPDGAHVALPRANDIAVADVRTGATRMLPVAGASALAWADGRLIVVRAGRALGERRGSSLG
jgi:hypothetical protein